MANKWQIRKERQKFMEQCADAPRDGRHRSTKLAEARIAWDRRNEPVRLGPLFPAPTQSFPEKRGERDGQRRKRFLAYLRAFPMPKAKKVSE